MLPNSATLFGGGIGNGRQSRETNGGRNAGSRAAQTHGEKMRGRRRGNKQITLYGWFFGFLVRVARTWSQEVGFCPRGEEVAPSPLLAKKVGD